MDLIHQSIFYGCFPKKQQVSLASILYHAYAPPSIHSLPSTSLKEVTTTWAPLLISISQNGLFIAVGTMTLSLGHRFSTIHS